MPDSQLVVSLIDLRLLPRSFRHSLAYHSQYFYFGGTLRENFVNDAIVVSEQVSLKQNSRDYVALRLYENYNAHTFLWLLSLRFISSVIFAC